MTETAVVDQWQNLRTNPRRLKADADNLHQAAQLMAMAGKHSGSFSFLPFLFTKYSGCCFLPGNCFPI